MYEWDNIGRLKPPGSHYRISGGFSHTHNIHISCIRVRAGVKRPINRPINNPKRSCIKVMKENLRRISKSLYKVAEFLVKPLHAWVILIIATLYMILISLVEVPAPIYYIGNTLLALYTMFLLVIAFIGVNEANKEQERRGGI